MRITFLLVALIVHSTKSNETCEEECTTSCEINCPEARTCSEVEIDCGTMVVVPTPPDYCEESRVCVPNNCQCQTKDVNGEDCPMSCTTECQEEDALCVGITDSRGCKQADFCIARAKDAEGNLCPGVCPVSCLPEQMQCSVPNDAQGCAQSPTCVEKGADENTGMSCPGVCPTTCKDNEMHCSGGITDGSCPVADTCVAKGTDRNAQLCPGCCPVECTGNEILCHGSIMPNECPMADSCKPKAKDSNGAYCPDNSASHNCAVSCKEEETMCPGHLNQLGCKDEDVCKAMTKDRDGNFCPATSVCHVPCKVNEISCSGGMDVNGCKKPDMCLSMGRDYENNLCPAHCPSECNSDEQITCSGKVNADGCRAPDICVGRDVKRCGADIGDPCSGVCPVECAVHEIKCASQLDCNCCPTEEVCRPKAKDINGMSCPDQSASHNCPKICDERSGEVLCPVYEDNIGCKPEEVCMVKSTGQNGNYCPEHSVCPKHCGNNEILCPDGEDANGCKNADMCISKGTDLDGNLCSIECSPVCNDNTAVLCKGGSKANGCKEPDFCEAKMIGSDGAQCVAICQHNPCPETGIVIPGEPDTNGCLTESTCGVPKVFGPWANEGSCQASGEDPNCGPGTQMQTRTCVDGTIDPCTAAESERRISCEAAGTQLDMCYIETTYCLKYETGDVSHADSGSTAEVEVTLSNDPNCKILFSLSEDKGNGGSKLECSDVACTSGKDSPQFVRMRQDGTDGWFVEKMQIQTYPGSSDFITYSMNGQTTQFWVDGNSDTYDGYPACDDGKWCDLKTVGS